jgi:hypothetical protein
MNESNKANEKKMNKMPTINFCRRPIFKDDFLLTSSVALLATPFEFFLAIETEQFLQK